MSLSFFLRIFASVIEGHLNGSKSFEFQTINERWERWER